MGDRNRRFAGPVRPGDRATWPTVFTALKEQLGLKLEPAKAPVDLIVLDHVSRPVAN